jgi:hypothetical protein
MRRDGKILLLVRLFFWLDCLKEGLVNLVAFWALMEMVVYLRKNFVYIFSLQLQIDVARQDIEKFRAEHLLVLDGEDASN